MVIDSSLDSQVQNTQKPNKVPGPTVPALLKGPQGSAYLLNKKNIKNKNRKNERERDRKKTLEENNYNGKNLHCIELKPHSAKTKEQTEYIEINGK